MTVFLQTRQWLCQLSRLKSVRCKLRYQEYSTSKIRFSQDPPKQPCEDKESVKHPKIYTKTGDSGFSSTFTGERRSKDDYIFQALGAVDELTSMLGLAREFALEGKHDYTDHLQRVQCILQDVNSCIATPHSSAREIHLQRTEFDSSHVDEIEEWIDLYSNQMPPLESFILPGGGKPSSTLHVSRTICRRAERAVVPLVKEENTNPETLRYLNRLSDLLFTLARYAAKLDGRKETIYFRPVKKE